MRSPRQNPITTEPSPEKIPLRRTISRGSLADSFLVQLFSIPQQTQARRMKSEPKENLKLEISSNDRSIHDAVTKIKRGEERMFLI